MCNEEMLEEVEEISSISSNVKCISRILYWILCDPENFSSHEITTLCCVLVEKAENLNDNINNLIIKLQK